MIRNCKTIMISVFCLQVAAMLLFSGCSTGSNGKTFVDSVFSPSVDEAKQRLNTVVREYIQAESNESGKVDVKKRRPYYFKEYAIFPDGNDAFSVEFREADSRVRPMIAEVKINKIRYSTRMHRKYDRAREDNILLRDTGVETLVYELRSGRWVRTGAIFDAEKTEEQINGEWMPRSEETQRIIPAEERPGFFKRLWMRIRGEKE